MQPNQTKANYRRPPKRGTCPVCGYRQKLLKDGVTVAHHILYSGLGVNVCRGAGQPEKYAAVNAAARAANEAARQHTEVKGQ